MRWTTYTVAMLLFSLVGWLLVYLLQRLQGVLPFNPQGLPRVEHVLVVQYGRLVHDEHQLAGLRRRSRR